MSTSNATPNRASRGEQLVQYIAGTTAHRNYPPQVVEAALQALVDHLGCAVGAADDARRALSAAR